jgi:hypothetical protein
LNGPVGAFGGKTAALGGNPPKNIFAVPFHKASSVGVLSQAFIYARKPCPASIHAMVKSSAPCAPSQALIILPVLDRTALSQHCVAHANHLAVSSHGNGGTNPQSDCEVAETSPRSADSIFCDAAARNRQSGDADDINSLREDFGIIEESSSASDPFHTSVDGPSGDEFRIPTPFPSSLCPKSGPSPTVDRCSPEITLFGLLYPYLCYGESGGLLAADTPCPPLYESTTEQCKPKLPVPCLNRESPLSGTVGSKQLPGPGPRGSQDNGVPKGELPFVQGRGSVEPFDDQQIPHGPFDVKRTSSGDAPWKPGARFGHRSYVQSSVDGIFPVRNGQSWWMETLIALAHADRCLRLYNGLAVPDLAGAMVAESKSVVRTECYPSCHLGSRPAGYLPPSLILWHLQYLLVSFSLVGRQLVTHGTSDQIPSDAPGGSSGQKRQGNTSSSTDKSMSPPPKRTQITPDDSGPGDGGEEDDSDGADEDDSDDGSDPGTTLHRASGSPNFACPFAKRFATGYDKCHTALLRDVRRVKQHVKRTKNPAHPLPSSTRRDLSDRSLSTESEPQRWNTVYRRLFPDAALPSSPYNTWVSVDVEVPPEHMIREGGPIRGPLPDAALPRNPYNPWVSLDPASLREHAIREGGPICYEVLRARLPGHRPEFYEDLRSAVDASFGVAITRCFDTYDPASPPSQLSPAQPGLSSAAQQMEHQAERAGVMSDSGLGSSITNASQSQNELGLATETTMPAASQHQQSSAQVGAPVDFIQAMETSPDIQPIAHIDSTCPTMRMDLPGSPGLEQEPEVPRGEFLDWMSQRSVGSPVHSLTASARAQRLQEGQEEPMSTQDLLGIGARWPSPQLISEAPLNPPLTNQCGTQPQQLEPRSFATPDTRTPPPPSVEHKSNVPCITPVDNWAEINSPF